MAAAEVAGSVDAAVASVEGADVGGTGPAGSQDLELFEATVAGQQGANGAEGAEEDECCPGLPEGAIKIAVTQRPKGSVHLCRGKYS